MELRTLPTKLATNRKKRIKIHSRVQEIHDHRQTERLGGQTYNAPLFRVPHKGLKNTTFVIVKTLLFYYYYPSSTEPKSLLCVFLLSQSKIKFFYFLGRYLYMGDFKTEDMDDAPKAKKFRAVAIQSHSRLSRKNLCLKQKNYRLTKKIKSFKALMTHLKKQHLLTSGAVDQVLVSIFFNFF